MALDMSQQNMVELIRDYGRLVEDANQQVPPSWLADILEGFDDEDADMLAADVRATRSIHTVSIGVIIGVCLLKGYAVELNVWDPVTDKPTHIKAAANDARDS